MLYQKFVILSTNRSGTNWLITLLNSHPNVRVLRECFNPEYCYSFPHISSIEPRLYTSFRDTFPSLFLRYHVYKPYPQEIRAVGFKLMYTQAKDGRASRVWTWLRDNRDVKIIHLKRTNLLASYVSMLLTVKTHLFMATSTSQIHPTRLTINPEECRRYFIEISAYQQYYDHFFQNNDVLSVTYEKLVSNREKQTSAMQAFLKLPQTHLTSSLIKLNSSPLSYTIKNYTSLKQRFQKTEWSSFFSG